MGVLFVSLLMLAGCYVAFGLHGLYSKIRNRRGGN